MDRMHKWSGSSGTPIWKTLADLPQHAEHSAPSLANRTKLVIGRSQDMVSRSHFEEFVIRHRNREDAGDAVQDAYVSAFLFRAFDTLASAGVRAWLLAITAVCRARVQMGLV